MYADDDETPLSQLTRQILNTSNIPCNRPWDPEFWQCREGIRLPDRARWPILLQAPLCRPRPRHRRRVGMRAGANGSGAGDGDDGGSAGPPHTRPHAEARWLSDNLGLPVRIIGGRR